MTHRQPLGTRQPEGAELQRVTPAEPGTGTEITGGSGNGGTDAADATAGRIPTDPPEENLRFLIVTSSDLAGEIRTWPLLSGTPHHVIEEDSTAPPAVLRTIERWEPDVCLLLNVSVPFQGPPDLPRSTIIELRTNIEPIEGGDPENREQVVVATARELPAADDAPSPLTRASAPIYRNDTGLEVMARASELAMRVFELSLERARGDDPPDASLSRGTDSPEEGSTGRPPGEPSTGRRHGKGLTRRMRAGITEPGLVLKTLVYLVTLWLIRPLRDLVRTVTGRHPVRVFTFHRLSELCRDGMTVAPRVFRRQLEYLRKHHRIVGIQEGLRLLHRGARLRRPAAVLTFDDGYRTVYEFAAPVLAELGLPACCFVATDFVGTSRRFPWDRSSPVREFLPIVTWEELRALHRAGWTIGGHTASHARLADCTSDRLRLELEAPMEALRARLGVRHVPMAYPFGGPDDISEEGRHLARALGYTACFSNFGGENFPPASTHDLQRIDLGGDHRTLAWKSRAHGFDFGRSKRLRS